MSFDPVRDAQQARDALLRRAAHERRRESQRLFGHTGASVPHVHPTDDEVVREMARAVISTDRARLRQALDKLKLHDNTGDPYDQGYMAAWDDFAALLLTVDR